MGADVTFKGPLGLETGEGGGLGKNDVLTLSGWLALCGETTITSSGFELAPAEKKGRQLVIDHSITNKQETIVISQQGMQDYPGYPAAFLRFLDHF